MQDDAAAGRAGAAQGGRDAGAGARARHDAAGLLGRPRLDDRLGRQRRTRARPSPDGQRTGAAAARRCRGWLRQRAGGNQRRAARWRGPAGLARAAPRHHRAAGRRPADPRGRAPDHRPARAAAAPAVRGPARHARPLPARAVRAALRAVDRGARRGGAASRQHRRPRAPWCSAIRRRCRALPGLQLPPPLPHARVEARQRGAAVHAGRAAVGGWSGHRTLAAGGRRRLRLAARRHARARRRGKHGAVVPAAGTRPGRRCTTTAC